MEHDSNESVSDSKTSMKIIKGFKSMLSRDDWLQEELQQLQYFEIDYILMIRRSYYSAQLPSIRVTVYSYGKLWFNLG